MTLLGVQEPRLLVVPAGASGAPAGTDGPIVIEHAEQCGMTLDPWQQFSLITGLAKGADGLYVALEVVELVPRQNGKSGILGALVATAPRLGHRKVIYSAHEFKTALETYDLARELVEYGPLGECEPLPKFRRSGTETGLEWLPGTVFADGSKLKHGCRVHFMARSRSSGRGFSADLVVMDEAFSIQAHTMAAILPTLSARPNPQVWYGSSAPLHDSEQLHQLRERALGPDPEARDLLTLMEWSVEAGTSNDDREAWAKANPALGYRLQERVIRTELTSLSPQDFARERLGIPDEPDGITKANMEHWAALIDGDSEAIEPLAFALDVTPERDNSAIAVAGMRIDGLAHVEVVEHLPGTEWVVARCVELWERYGVPVWIQTSTPAASFIETLQAKGVEVKAHPLGGGSAALLDDAIRNSTLRHLGQGSMSRAMAGTRKRRLGDTWTYSRSASTVDICPLVAVSLAHYGAMVEPPAPAPRKARVL